MWDKILKFGSNGKILSPGICYSLYYFFRLIRKKKKKSFKGLTGLLPPVIPTAPSRSPCREPRGRCGVRPCRTMESSAFRAGAGPGQSPFPAPPSAAWASRYSATACNTGQNHRNTSISFKNSPLKR